MKKEIYTNLFNKNKRYACWLLLLLLPLNFSAFAWSYYVSIINNSPEIIHINYKGGGSQTDGGNAYGSCGKNMSGYTCAVAAHSSTTLKLTRGEDADGTIGIATTLGDITYAYVGQDDYDELIELSVNNKPPAALVSHVQARTDDECYPTNNANCIIYTNTSTQKK